MPHFRGLSHAQLSRKCHSPSGTESATAPLALISFGGGFGSGTAYSRTNPKSLRPEDNSLPGRQGEHWHAQLARSLRDCGVLRLESQVGTERSIGAGSPIEVLHNGGTDKPGVDAAFQEVAWACGGRRSRPKALLPRVIRCRVDPIARARTPRAYQLENPLDGRCRVHRDRV